MLLVNLLLIILAILAYGHRQARIAASTSEHVETNAISDESLSPLQVKNVEALVRAWAPLVWFAPGEVFFPISVPEFLEHVNVTNATTSSGTDLPEGPRSRNSYLVTISDVDILLNNRSSILYGTNPESGFSVPVYAHVTLCSSDSGSFHVTYWMFFPYNQGKKMCTVNLGFLGPLPVPRFRNYCLGTVREFGSHVGDWEHMSLNFEGGSSTPSSMYVSTHDAGAYYKYHASGRIFVFSRQEVRKGIMQRPMFPQKANLTPKGSHAVLFAAKGSHGLWTAPGKHKFVRIPRLYDYAGYGTKWETWRSVEISYSTSNVPNWARYWGRWGNPRSDCHPFAKLGLNICQLSDGPTGIPLKKQNFKCKRNVKL